MDFESLFEKVEQIARDFWKALSPVVNKIKEAISRKAKEKPEETLAVSTGIAVAVSFWVGGIVASAVLGALGLTTGILILAKYLPDTWKKKISESKGLQAAIDIFAFLIAVKVLTGVTGLFAGIFSTVMVTAGIGLMCKSWKNIEIPQSA